MGHEMSDKYLSLQAWKTFARNRNYKDAALLKALGDLDKFGDGQPDERLRALDEAEKQSELLAKGAKGDKDLAAYVGDLLKQAKVARKAAELARAARDKQAAQAEAEDDDAPDLLTTKLASLLKEVRRGVPMHAMLAIGSAESAVLLSRKPIPAPRRSLLVDYLGTSSGVKFPIGQCLWEENAFTFVLASASLAPAKKVRAALKAQVGTLSKIRVRGMDPADVDEGDQEDEAEEKDKDKDKDKDKVSASRDKPGSPSPSAALTARLTALQPRIKARLAEGGAAEKEVKLLVSEIGALIRQDRIAPAQTLVDALEKRLGGTGIPVPPPLPPASGKAADPAMVFKSRLTALQPRIKDAVAAGGPAAARVAAHSREVAALGQQKDFTQALAALDKLEALLAPRGGTPAQTAPKAASPSAGKGTLALWQAAKDVAGEQLNSLAGALRGSGHPLLIRIAEQGLHGLTRRLQVGLQAALMDYDGASQDARAKAAAKVKALLADYRDFLKTDATLPLLERNPLGITVDIRTRLGSALDLIDARLRADQA